MFRSPLFRRLFLSYLGLIALCVAVLGYYGARQFRQSYFATRRQELANQTQLVTQILTGELSGSAAADLRQQTKRLAGQIGYRITVIAADGTVIADSEADPAMMERHDQRPEILQAARQGTGTNLRPSATLHDQMLYVARRTEAPAGGVYFVRLAAHVRDLDRQVHLFYVQLLVTAVLAVLLAAIISIALARGHALPLVQLTEFAHSVSLGVFSRRLLHPGKGEVGILAAALNQMSASLDQMVSQIAHDKAELLTILTSMNEGVIATDLSQRIVLINGAAGSLLDIPVQGARGKLLWEVIRNPLVLKSATEVLARAQQTVLPISPSSGRHLQITLCTFPLAAVPRGLILVVRDVTQATAYQELRKEFVANVSHELRTPLSVIKGYVETLRDGAAEDQSRRNEYLATISRHTDQLTNLVSDLLELSRLESHAGTPRAVPVDVSAIAAHVTEMFQTAAQRKSHTLVLSAAGDAAVPRILGNPDYIERAIANLVDNAIKYTPDGGRIEISVQCNSERVGVEVRDSGIGIPADDLPRIFERFYRVDRSRSREMGGTGLGLSIVKHIMQAHNGSVEVESTPGSGSTFRLKFPLPMPATA